jgi:Rieske Fe-S protein
MSAEESTDLVSIVDRRTFLAQGALAAAAAALAACGLSSEPTAPGTLASPLTINVADYAALASVHGVAFVSAERNPLAIVRTGTSSFVALSRICPHAGSTVNTASFGFLCPGHGAEFDETGRWIGGQRTSSLTSYPTQYDAATGMLTVG